MATILQQQLAAIAAKSTHQLDLKAQKAQHSKSLLFEARDAASQSFDTLYQICLEGFEELCHLDVRFTPFARSLFSEQSKNEDRTQMTAKENDHLDSIIVRFLGLLAGRLLLKPAVKAAEWLVRRFRVHEYNTEALLLTFLPYHQSYLFPTLLSILPPQLPPNFRFLHPYVSSLHNPPRHAIVVAASSNSAFFTAFGQYVLNVARARNHSTILLGFWASITAQAVNGLIDASKSGRETVRRQKEEDLLLRVLPILQDALAIKDVPELYLGSCMIMTILATKSSLSEKALNAMMEAIVAGWTEHTVEEGIMCLAVLAEEKENITSVPLPVAVAMWKLDNIFSIVTHLSSKCRVRKLLISTSCCAIGRAQEAEGLQFLKQSLEAEILDEQDKVVIVRDVLTYAIKDREYARDTILPILSSIAEQQVGTQLINTASQQAGVDVAQIDATLVLGSGSGTDEVTEEPEPMELDEVAESGKPHSKPNFTHLARVPGKSISFLAPSQDDSFATYALAFREALSSSQNLSAFLRVLSPEQSCLRSPVVLSFLARVWCTESLAQIRVRALRVAAGLLQKEHEHQSLDMQNLLPYVMVGLIDSSKAVRSAATSVCVGIAGLQDAAKKRNSTSTNANLWASGTIYGAASTNLHTLDPADTRKLLGDVILPVLEECVLNSNFLVQIIAESINTAPAISKANSKDTKSGTRAGVYAYLASHVATTPLEDAQIPLLSILEKVGKAAGPARVQVLLPYIKAAIEQTIIQTSAVASEKLCNALVKCISHRSHDELQFLMSLASGGIGNPQMSRLGFDGLQRVWPAMSGLVQSSTIDWLLNLSLSRQTHDDIRSEAAEVLQSLELCTSTLVHLVEDLPTVQELQGQPTPAKKPRTSRTSDLSKAGNLDKEKLHFAIHRITVVLELVETAKPGQHPQLLKGLFRLLGELHHYKALMDSELTYLQSLLVNSLLPVVNGLKASSSTGSEADRSAIRPDLIVDCVRSTSSTHVHQSALLLMSALASWAPDLVLHSVMPLFTFMSSTILKQGDDYSAHVTDQTVSRIVPPLAASLKNKGRDLVTGAADLLLSFVAAYEHIPLHRRSDLFQHLVRTLGPGEALFAIMAMLLERYSDDQSVQPFVANLMDNFPAAVQMSAVRQYLDIIFDSLKAKRNFSDALLGFAEKNQEQVLDAQRRLLSGLADILNRNALRHKLARDLQTNVAEIDALRTSYSIVLGKTMELGLQLKHSLSLRLAADQLLKAVLGLMPSKDFIDSSAKLMQTGSDEIRQQVFQSLEQRVQSAKSGDTSLQQTFIDVLPNCAIFVAASQPIETRLAAIACIDRIADKFGKIDRHAVMQATEVITGPAALSSSDNSLRRLSLLCLTSMVEVLGDEFIAILPKTLERALAYSQESLDSDDPDQPLLAASFTFATAILDYVPWMLSGPYLDRLLLLAADADDDDARQFANVAARKLAPHEIIPSIERVWQDIVDLGADAARLHLTTLQSVIQHHPKSVIAKNAQNLFSVLVKSFDLRRALHLNEDEDEDEDEDNAEVLSLVNSTTMEAILKLNDATFRPFFIRLCEWASTSLPKSDTKGRTLRKLSFYSFVLVFFEQLKSLVTTYISYILDDAAAILQSSNKEDALSAELADVVIRACASNFSQDEDGFWQSPSHFDVIVGPLVDRLKQAGTIDALESLIPAIVELASAAASPEHHKTIDDKLLTFMRHDEPAVRLAAVKTERALTERLSFDWCNLIPAWLPFIAELQEDDDGAVERETLRWMEQIQGVTGESVNDMLR